jgi:PAS domain S-box-containing protein
LDLRAGWTPAVAAFVVAVAYYLGARIGFALTFSPYPLAVLWPPNATLMAALLLIHRRHWMLVFAAVFVAHLLVQLGGHVSFSLCLFWFATNCVEALIGAGCILKMLGRAPDFGRIADVSVFLFCGALLAPFVSSFLDAGCVTLMRASPTGFWDLWRARLFSNMLAMITLVPFLLNCAYRWPGLIGGRLPERPKEAALLISGLLLSGMLVFDVPPQNGVLLGLLFLPLPFVLWTAMRFGPAGSGAAFTLIAFLVIWGSTHGRGPFLTGEASESVRSVQVFLTVFGATLLLLAAGVEESRVSARRLRSSEERFAAAFRHGPHAMLISRKASGMVLDVNARYLSLFGCGREAVVGRTIQELELKPGGDGMGMRLHPGHTPSGEYAETAALAGREVLVASEEVDLEGVACLITSLQDVTEQKRAEESLRRSDERFRLVLRATDDVIYDWDIVGDVLWWNQNGDIFFGAMSDPRPRNFDRWAQSLHADDRQRVTSTLMALLNGTDSICNAEYRLARGDGSHAYVGARGFLVRDERGRALRMIGSLHDVTDRKRADEANQRLAHVSRLAVMGELTASIAHEINQPLGAILSNTDAAEILLNEKDIPAAELRQIIEDIRNDIVRAGEVIRHMRALMRRRELAMQSFDLNRAIGDVLNLASADLGRHRVQVDTEFGPLPAVYGDQVHVQQVVLNLLLNGVDAMAALPNDRRRITLRTQRIEGGWVGVTVADTGPGIASEQAENLFSSFFTTKPDGMGLGLSIARSIVEAHGGTIRAETAATGGASFTFTLPGRPGQAETGRTTKDKEKEKENDNDNRNGCTCGG